MKMGVITEIEDENGRKPLKMGLKQNKDLKIKRKNFGMITLHVKALSIFCSCVWI